MTYNRHLVVSLPSQVYFGMLDALLAAEQLPEEYKDRTQVLLPHVFNIYMVPVKLLFILFISVVNATI